MATELKSVSTSTNSNDSGISLTEDDLDNIEDFDDFDKVINDYGVDIDMSGLDDLDSMKERLREYIFKIEVGNFKQLISQSMEAKAREDKHKRGRLLTLVQEYKATMTQLTTGSDEVKSEIEANGTLQDLFQQIEFVTKLLEENECKVVIAGETGAGKSSLINLLLNETLLPTHCLSCTSVVTRICYGKSLKAVVKYRDGPPKTFENFSQETLEEKIWPIIYVKEENNGEDQEIPTTRETLSDIQEVCFELPSRILKCGLVLLDSPGIGENDVMDSVIAQYLQDHHVTGYIFIIKSDNAGGVEDDRLLSLIRFVRDRHDSRNGNLPFNTRGALFVCNRWDILKPSDQNEVLQNAVSTLKSCWPELEADQITPMSAKSAEKEYNIDPDFVSEMFKVFLEHLRDFFIQVSDNTIEWINEWLNQNIRTSLHYTRSVVNKSKDAQDIYDEQIKEIKDRLDILENSAKSFLLATTQELERETECLAKRFTGHMQTRYIKQRFTNWDEEELEALASLVKDTHRTENQHHWLHIKQRLDETIENKLGELIKDWEDENHHISDIEKKMIHSVNDTLNLQHDEDVLRESCNLRGSLAKVLEIPEEHSQNDTMSTAKSQEGAFETSSQGKISKRDHNPFVKMLMDRKESAFRRNPKQIVEKRATKLLMKLNKNNCLLVQDMIRLIMSGLRGKLENLTRRIKPLTISNNKKLSKTLTARQQSENVLCFCSKYVTDLNLHVRSLQDFNHGYMLVRTFLNDEIQLKDEEWLSCSSRKSKSFRSSDIRLRNPSRRKKFKSSAYGLWTVLYPVDIVNNIGNSPLTRDATIRMYLPSSGVNTTYREVSRLRQVKHPCIAVFLGIQYSDSPPPVVVYDSTLQTIESRKKYQGDFKSDVPKIIRDTARGLSCLHSWMLVHMELSQETVTVDAKGSVKLTGGCFPRRASLPNDQENTLADSFVYLSQEALSGQRYNSMADVYAFGLFVFELLSGEKAYAFQRRHCLKKFIENVNTLNLIKSDNSYLSFTLDVQNFIQVCLSASSTCPSSFNELICVLDRIDL